MASISPRRTKDGTTRYAVVWREHGRQREKWFDRRGEAKAFMGAVETNHATGTPTPSRRLRLDDLIDMWWVDHVLVRTAPATQDLYDLQLRRRLRCPENGIAGVRVMDLTHQRLDQYVARLTAAGHSPRAVNTTLTVLSSILSRGVEWGLVTRNAVKGVERLKESGRAMRAYTPEEVKTIADAVALERDYAMIVTSAFTGMRIGELMALHWEDVLTNAIRVTRTLNHKDRTFKPPKNNRERLVPLLRQVEKTLAAWRSVAPDTDLVFPNERGRPLLKSNWHRRVWRPACTDAANDTPHLHDALFHEMRHTFPSVVIGQGASALQIRDWMGHSTIQITFDRYGHLFERDTQAVIEKVNERLEEAFATQHQPSNSLGLLRSV